MHLENQAPPLELLLIDVLPEIEATKDDIINRCRTA